MVRRAVPEPMVSMARATSSKRLRVSSEKSMWLRREEMVDLTATSSSLLVHSAHVELFRRAYAAMLLLPGRCRAAGYCRPADAFLGPRTTQRLQRRYTGGKWVAVIAIAAAGAHWGTGCAHARHDA